MSLALTSLSIAQTRIVAPKNKYSVAEDVKLGREAAAQVKKELPMLNDERVDDYVETIGARLAGAVPPEFRHPEFQYTFDVVNQKEINAFALPGGPMFLNRGMIEAAKTEGEVAGVMAHEMSHVARATARRHLARSNRRRPRSDRRGDHRRRGSILSIGCDAAGAYNVRRAYESRDILGRRCSRVQATARDGEHVQDARGGRRLVWPQLSSHPDPGNRYNAIIKESASLRVEGNANTGQFQSVRDV